MIAWLQSKVASQYSRFVPQEKIIGIAGSFHQEATAEACRAVLSQQVEVVRTINQSDPVSAVSKALLQLGPKVGKGLFVLSSKHFGQMGQLLRLVKPKIGIISGIDFTNSGVIGNLDQILEENSRLLVGLPASGSAILNWNDLYSRKLADKTDAEVIFFGTDSENCHLWAGNLVLKNYQINFELNYGVERVEIASNLVGKHQIFPLLAAATLGIKEGLRLTQIKKGLESVKAEEHQLKVLNGFNGSVVLDDTEQDSPTLVEQALETLNYLPARRRILVLGEIKRLGSFSEKIHKQLAHKIYKEKYDLVLIAKGQTKITADELLKLGFIAERMEAELVNPQIVASLLKVLAKGDVVLVIGSKELRLDEVVAKIAKK